MRAIEYQPGGVAVAVTIAPMVLGLYFGKPIFLWPESSSSAWLVLYWSGASR